MIIGGKLPNMIKDLMADLTHGDSIDPERYDAVSRILSALIVYDGMARVSDKLDRIAINLGRISINLDRSN